jgi:hypothetical protein
MLLTSLLDGRISELLAQLPAVILQLPASEVVRFIADGVYIFTLEPVLMDPMFVLL